MLPGNEGPTIRIEGLTKTFGTQTVLDGIDLAVQKNESLAVLGRSGSGKSVLLKLIIGLIKPDEGRIQIHGEEVPSLTPDRLNNVRKSIGFVFQSAALYDSLTVEENVAFPLKHHAKMSETQRREKVEQLLTRVGMIESMNKLPQELSGGMKKRVGLARALALDPGILLLDEPTAGLDPLTAGEINELICHLQQERQASSVIVTHDMHTVKAVSSRAAILHEGKILMEGTFEALQRSNTPVVSDFMKQSF